VGHPEDEMKKFEDTGWFEAFEAGDYGDKGAYTTDDLDHMVDAVKSGAHVVPIFRGHQDDDDPKTAELADGKVTDAKRDGDVIMLRADVTPEHKSLWKNNRLLTWSVGIYKDFKKSGKPVLRHLAALGQTPPRIKGLQYTPAFEEDAENGEFDEFEFKESNTTTHGGTDDMSEVERQLREENAKLKTEKEVAEAKAAAFKEAEENHQATVTELEKFKKEKADAEARVKAIEAEREQEKLDATFAEIDRRVTEAHEKEGLPKASHDAYCIVQAVEMGLPVDDGKVTFAEGKSGVLSEAMKALRENGFVPMDREAGDHKKKGDGTTLEFSELDDEGKAAKLNELATVQFAELKKADDAATLDKAIDAVIKKHPELE
jgi:hypothetical protein